MHTSKTTPKNFCSFQKSALLKPWGSVQRWWKPTSLCIGLCAIPDANEKKMITFIPIIRFVKLLLVTYRGIFPKSSILSKVKKNSSFQSCGDFTGSRTMSCLRFPMVGEKTLKIDHNFANSSKTVAVG